MPIAGTLQALCLVIYAAVLLVAAWQDWRTLRIADFLPFLIIGAFVVWSVSGYLSGRTPIAEIAFAATTAVVIVAVGLAAFAVGVLGGGDVKLLATAALFAGRAYLVEFLLVVALAGGALALAALMGVTVGPRPVDHAGLRKRLAYGPAIAAGALWVAAARFVA